ncbi:DUF2790 domain-containing protein [Pseudomonas sp. NA-150]|uniref:DUF2790 domain-containing protein n=1 Tax=Pseudomonas sp. NA-150 TaxID=3367525 RepID=UPI0037C5C5EB
MKAALLMIAITGFSASAMAATLPDASSKIPVEQYTYSTPLDIAKVVWMSTIPISCDVVPARMDYIDSKGKEHLIEYQVMGNGCVDG